MQRWRGKAQEHSQPDDAARQRAPGKQPQATRDMPPRSATPGGRGTSVSEAPTSPLDHPTSPHSSTSHARTLGDVPTVTTQAVPRVGSDSERSSPRALVRRDPIESQIIPASAYLQRARTRKRPQRRYTLVTSGFVMIAVILALVLAVSQSIQTQHGAGAGPDSQVGVPPPSGTGPFMASAGAVVYLKPTPRPTPAVTYSSASGGIGSANINTLTDVTPCHGGQQFVANISQWSVPPGCYGQIFVPSPSDYPARPAVGYCNWWVEENHLSNPTITEGGQIYVGTKPIAGAAVWFAPLVQGASQEGHWAQVVAVAPGGYWMLISEMNFSWRGAGFGRVDYRYVHAGSGISFYK